MEALALLAAAVFGALVGYTVGLSRGKRVNRPVGEPLPKEPYNERSDRR